MKHSSENLAADVSQASISNVKHQKSNIPWRILDFLIGGLFVYAGVIKVLDPAGFAIDIDNYKILPWTIGVRLAFYLPWLEMFCGTALIARKFYAGGLSVLILLVLGFIGASIAAKARGIDASCGCFGHASKNLSFAAHLILDLVILGGLIALWFAQRTRVSARDAD